MTESKIVAYLLHRILARMYRCKTTSARVLCEPTVNRPMYGWLLAGVPAVRSLVCCFLLLSQRTIRFFWGRFLWHHFCYKLSFFLSPGPNLEVHPEYDLGCTNRVRRRQIQVP
ncbi:hypothetical protein F4703DRAFT_1790156 [Phycomyces blakesleeanus]